MNHLFLLFLKIANGNSQIKQVGGGTRQIFVAQLGFYGGIFTQIKVFQIDFKNVMRVQ